LRYRLIKYSAWGALFWERLWRAVWPAVALLVGLAAFTLLDVWRLLPPLVGGVALALYLAVMIVALGAGLWGLDLPTSAQVLRWLERRHGMAHRPLALAEDRLATPATRTSSILWDEQKRRAAEGTRHMSPHMPHPGVAARDPWAARVLVVLVLFVAILAGGQHWKDKAGFLLAPFGYPQEEATVTAWLDPPQYTGKPPRSLSAPGNQGDGVTLMDVPQGTTLNIRVNGPRRTPILTALHERRAMTEEEARAYTLTYALTGSGEYRLASGGRELGLWRFDVTPDTAPKIAFSETPTVSARDSLHIAFTVDDDYGATEGHLLITRDGTDKKLDLPLPLPPPAPGKQQGSAYENLISHPWAGTQVLATLTVQDSAGQEGRSDSIAFTLPERQFTHPVARELIKLRKLLATGQQTADYVSRQLGLLTLHPEAFDSDLVAYMAIRTAAYRVTDPQEQTVDDTLQLMWDTALRIEDGATSMAEANMRDAVQALQDALSKDGTSPEEVQKLMQDLQRAMADYMQALADQQKKAGADGKSQQQAGAQGATPQSLQHMLDQVQNLAELGSKEDARKMLSELQSMLENMSVASQSQQKSAEQSEAVRQKLNDMRQQQQRLMDETYYQADQQDNPTARAQSTATQDLKERQEQLKSGLMAASRQMTGEGTPSGQAVKDAISSMTRAGDELTGGKLEDAVISQAQAIQSLIEAENAMAQQGEKTQAKGKGDNGNQGLGEADPSNSVVPAEGDLGRAREILNEIRRRAGDWQRPDIERKYLDRLLDRF
jgi:uncharacterized protein (TIGR02302 family)